MSARDDLYAYADSAHLGGDELDRLLDAVERAAAEQTFEQVLAAVRDEYLHDDTGKPEDEAYNQAINDAVVAIRKLRG